MTGENTLTLNEATMVAALQHYFSTVVFTAGHVPIVRTIEPDKQAYGQPRQFQVVVDAGAPAVTEGA